MIWKISSYGQLLQDCAVAMHPQFKSFASKRCTGVAGESARQDMVWANVRDIIIEHWKFENEEAQVDAVIMSQEPVKRPQTGIMMGSMLSLYMEAVRDDQSDARGNWQFSSEKKDMLDAAIEQYRKIPCVQVDEY